MVIFDSSVFVDDLRTGCHSQRVVSLDDLVRTSAVVLAELWRGATTQAEQIFRRALERRYPVLSPTERNWLESGQILLKM